MKGWDWMDIWAAIGTITVLGLLSFGGYAAVQDHSIRYYYLSDHGITQGRNGYCIDGYREWYMNDTGVFCSDDIQKTISVVKQMNDALTATRGRK